jgi:hypothetical protein
MATYEGRRIDGDAVVTVDGVLLDARNDLRNHSPGGFSWGYAGSGPSQLALGILAHHFHQAGDSPELADAKALALYHDFKLKLITPLQGDWQFDTHVVADTVNMVVTEESERYFALAMRLEVENRRLTQELSECYTMLEPSHTDEE